MDNDFGAIRPAPKPEPVHRRGTPRYGSTLRQGAVPMRRVNLDREARKREIQFGVHGEWLRSLPCCACYPEIYADFAGMDGRVLRAARPGAAVSVVSHVVHTRGAGGLAEDAVPHCRSHHDEWHVKGRKTYAARHEDPARIAEALWAISPSHPAQGTL